MDGFRENVSEKEYLRKKRLFDGISNYQSKITDVKLRVESQRKLFADKFNVPLPALTSPSHSMHNYSGWGEGLH
jgi:hypothetical protein